MWGITQFQKYENTKSFKITNFIEKIALQYTIYWVFCGITDYKLKIKPRQTVHYNSNLNSKNDFKLQQIPTSFFAQQ